MSTLTESTAWQALQEHQQEMAPIHMRDLFAQDPERFNKFSLRFEDLLLDYSKNRITEKTMTLLRDLAKQAGLTGWTERMLTGEKIIGSADCLADLSVFEVRRWRLSPLFFLVLVFLATFTPSSEEG